MTYRTKFPPTKPTWEELQWHDRLFSSFSVCCKVIVLLRGWTILLFMHRFVLSVWILKNAGNYQLSKILMRHKCTQAATVLSSIHLFASVWPPPPLKLILLLTHQWVAFLWWRWVRFGRSLRSTPLSSWDVFMNSASEERLNSGQ